MIPCSSMQVPKRRGEEEARRKRVHDDYVTPEKIVAMERQLERLKKTERPAAIAETQRLAEMGDFSENVGYQISKANLRRINGKIMTLEERLKTAILIERGASADGVVRIGSTVAVVVDGIQKSYEILGSSETDPTRDRISHLSPLGRALLGHRAGDEVTLATLVGEKIYHLVTVT
ncbi:TPA: transcription elongation factor GreA [Candidatus Uhrbacteria bacterium]|nr:transcription elongation factor GreA [Candidatus Uhrbacteria bacterium]